MDEEIKKPASAESSNKAKEENSELQKLEQMCEEYLNNWKRSAADLINYKKDEVQRAGMLVNYAKEDMIHKILPILDNFYLAKNQLPEKLKKGEEGTPQSIEWTKGFLQIHKQIEEFLKKEGVEEIETEGQKFNPETMEAIDEISGSPTSAESGIVVEELQKGYKMQGKVLRPAKVKISK